jgi:hypothetical protein
VCHSFIQNIQKEGGNDNNKYNNIPQRKVSFIAKRENPENIYELTKNVIRHVKIKQSTFKKVPTIICMYLIRKTQKPNYH